jgi:staphylococcal nuclease domain-containing protein 1
MSRAQVCATISGDSVVLRITDSANSLQAACLSHLEAPRLGSGDGRVRDDPGAWPAFDFLRRLTLGRDVVVSDSESAPDFRRRHPQFGALPAFTCRLALPDGEDVGLAVADAGWARVLAPAHGDAYSDSLVAAEASARAGGLGVWGESSLVRRLPAALDATALLRAGRFEAVVDRVLGGATFAVWLLPNFEYITLQLAGVRCPSAKRGSPERFGLEARAFSELRLMQRQVKVTVFQQNEKEAYVGRAVHPMGDISVFLLSEGLAQVFNPTAALVPNSEELRAAENQARQQQKNLWKGVDVQVLRSAHVDGQVISVKGSNSIEVDDGLAVRRVWLSGLRVPQFNSKERSEPLGLEAREFLRKLVIGRAVNCVVDYANEDRQFATVYVGNSCVNELMCENGLAQVFFQRNQQQSDRIDAMTRKQEEAKRKRIGVHAPGKQQPVMINDLSSKGNRQKSGAFLHYIQNKRSRGILEHFASSTRVVVLVPDHHCLI